jgi:hypothetical protein
MLLEYYTCADAALNKPGLSLALVRARCRTFAVKLNTLRDWSDSYTDIIDACDQLSPHLKQLKENTTMEILTHGI